MSKISTGGTGDAPWPWSGGSSHIHGNGGQPDNGSLGRRSHAAGGRQLRQDPRRVELRDRALPGYGDLQSRRFHPQGHAHRPWLPLRSGWPGLVFAINADPTGRGESDQALGITDQSNGQVHITIDTNDTGQSTDTIARGYRITLGIYERKSGRYVWRAEINDLKPDADPMAATKPMVEKLMAALEKSVKTTD